MSDDPREKGDGLEAGPHDVVLVHGKTEDGEGLRALRSRPGRLSLAELRPIREGKPLAPSAELIRLSEREGSPLLWDVEVLHASEHAEGTSAAHEGPPRVSNARYRENWEAIFGPASPRNKPAN